MRGGDDLRFPVAVAGGDGGAQRGALDPGAGPGDVEQVFDRHRRDAEAALAFGDHEFERAQLR